MKAPSYKRDFNKSFLIFDLEWIKGDSFFQIKMITENKIKGLVPCQISTYNGQAQIQYDITGKQTLACIFEKKRMEREDLEMILFGIRNAFFNMQEYLLDENCILLSPELIYVDLTKKDIYLCFYPFEQGDIRKKMGEFAEYLLEKIDHEKQEVVVTAYEFYRLMKEENASFYQIVETIFEKGEEILVDEEIMEEQFENDDDNIEGEIENSDTKSTKDKGLFYVSVLFLSGGIGYCLYVFFMLYGGNRNRFKEFLSSRGFFTGLCLIVLGGVFWAISFIYYREKLKSDGEKKEDQKKKPDERIVYQEEPYENYSDKNEGGELTVLISENEYREERCLVSIDKKKRRIEMKSFPFIIGKLEGSVDYVLEEKSISRMHAKFRLCEEENTVYISDLNSLNGTYINGIALQTGEESPVFAGDEIRLGRLSFLYQ